MTNEEKFVNELIGYIFAYPDDDYMTMECLCRKLAKHGLLDKADGHYQTHEIRTNTHECVKDTHDKTENSSEKPNSCEDDEYWKHLFIEVVKGHMSDAEANQAWYEYINRKTEPQTEPLPKTINGVRIADAVAWADKWLEDNSVSEMWDMIRTLRDATEWQDEPQTERSE